MEAGPQGSKPRTLQKALLVCPNFFHRDQGGAWEPLPLADNGADPCQACPVVNVPVHQPYPLTVLARHWLWRRFSRVTYASGGVC
jgi:hypothetical protein